MDSFTRLAWHLMPGRKSLSHPKGPANIFTFVPTVTLSGRAGVADAISLIVFPQQTEVAGKNGNPGNATTSPEATFSAGNARPGDRRRNPITEVKVGT